MKILSIETSCDDTSIALIEAKGNFKNASFLVLANYSNSQIEIHKNYGGVFPNLAKNEHQKNLPILFQKVLKKSKLEKEKKPFDLIAVTYGPGLEPSLWTGIVFAQELAKKFKTPILPVNHMEGHIFSVFGKENGSFNIKLKKNDFPMLSLLVSGGHTELVLIKDYFKYEIIGKTLDDAAGEAYDKVARMLDLSYPGGPKISKLAENFRAERNITSSKFYSFSFTRPMLHSKNFDFSFSGLKTAVLYLIRDLKKENENILQNEEIKKAIALEFENAVIETLVHKTNKAIEQFKAKNLIIGGGVACNTHLQREIKRKLNKKLKIYFPKKNMSGDNALMIGIAGYLNYSKNKKTVNPLKLKAKGGLSL